MKQFSGWQALFLSFCSPALYRDVARNWTGIALLYLLAVISATSLFVAIQINNWTAQGIEQYINPICDQMPKLTIENGKASIDKPSPYKVSDPKTGRTIITFDTREGKADEALEQSTAVVTATCLIIRNPRIAKGLDITRNGGLSAHGSVIPSDDETKEEERLAALYKDHPEAFNTKNAKYDFSSIPQFSLDRTQLHDMAQFYKQWTWSLVAAFLIPIYFVFCLIQVLIYALFGLAMSRMLNVGLPYAALVRLSVIALTPVLLIDSVLKVRGLMFGYWWIVSVLITLGYLFFGVRSNKEVIPPPSA
jgi:hypothetical protein